jgi:hypothetical protein
LVRTVPPDATTLDVEALAESEYEYARTSYRRERRPSWFEMNAAPHEPHDPKRPWRATNGDVLRGWRASAHEHAIRYATLAAARSEAPGELDAAWQEAEAALPKGASILLGDGRDAPDYGYWATASWRDDEGNLVIVGGKRKDHLPSPAGALRLLATKLREARS